MGCNISDLKKLKKAVKESGANTGRRDCRIERVTALANSGTAS